MKRKIYQNLLDWRNEKDHLPLMIIGARQVGKTYTITKFCEKEYKHYEVINLLERRDIVDIFKLGINAEDKYIRLKARLNIDIEASESIIFFDEIQESEELISNLKFLNENHSNVNIICAGSLLGVKLKRFKSSFPVGRVRMIDMYPMNFEEFLLAFNEDILINDIKYSFDSNTQLPEPFHTMALDYYRLYLCVGGMPDSVVNIIKVNKDVTKYDTNIVANILTAYFKDMNKYVNNKSEAIRIEKLYNSIPNQLSNESKKFQYSKIEKGAKKRGYELPMEWLMASRLLFSSSKVSVPEIPLKGFVLNDYFKLFLSDVGILRNMLDLKMGDILIDNLSLYKGAIIENYVATEFRANNINLYYWTSKGIAEIDFLLYTNDGIIPVEVKAGDFVKSKSLAMYIDKFNPKYSIRVSLKNFGFANGIKSVPLYAVFCIKNN